MRMIGAPLVYVGPTLSREAVQQAYPGCIVRPPIRRGDLYRDRMLRGAVFLIVDGVFFQDEAISPREIRDVIGDGAFVVGASSMGALRAAECWPAGMRGVGAIYRLFRSGALSSDDEVAVAFSAEACSVALVNVRYAARRAARDGRLSPQEARRLVGSASETFYEDRHWPLMLRAAGLGDRPQLQAALVSHDLKARDARRALARLGRWVREDAQLLERPRSSTRAFTPSDVYREREHDAYACTAAATAATAATTATPGRAKAAEPNPDTRLPLVRWLFASGRYLRYADGLIAARDAQPRPSPRAVKRAQAASLAISQERAHSAVESMDSSSPDARAAMVQSAYESADEALAQHGVASTAQTRAVYVALTLRERRAHALLRDFASTPNAYLDLVWLTLRLSDELDAELFRWHAQRMAAERAERASSQPAASARHAAELRIATTHGYRDWPALMETLADCPAAKALIEEHCRTHALVVSLRD
jgi:hypothetical protein